MFEIASELNRKETLDLILKDNEQLKRSAGVNS